jgi:hypothetical protein
LYDIRLGFSRNKAGFFIVGITFMFICGMLFSQSQILPNPIGFDKGNATMVDNPTPFDYMLFIFQGVPPYTLAPAIRQRLTIS